MPLLYVSTAFLGFYAQNKMQGVRTSTIYWKKELKEELFNVARHIQTQIINC